LSAKIKIPKFLKNNLNNKRISKIYKNFEKSLNLDENFIVAVSGGPDSLALAFLAKIYAVKKKTFIKVFDC
jgi:tRNA(Ile)-lysidine synthase